MQSAFFGFQVNTVLSNNLALIQTTIRQTALKVGRTPESVQLVAVSKTVPVDQMLHAIACGQTLFGENYLQEAATKIPVLPKTTRWHFIGHLQSNKVRQAVELFDVIETVDRWKIAKAVDEQARRINKPLSVLVQINIGGESQKSGLAPEEAEHFLRRLTQETKLQVLGLMTMPPVVATPEESRPFFKEMKRLAHRLAESGLFANNASVALSMGMSADYPIAIEEGATLIRVGTALFGVRPYNERSFQ